MNFRRGQVTDEPEINLIPFIDVLLVVLIFLMLSTTYSKYTELQINLPVASAEKPTDKPREVLVTITAEGRYRVNRKPVEGRSVELLVQEFTEAAGGQADARLIISADAMAAHQSVVAVLDAARRAGLNRLTFAAQEPGR